MCISADGKFLPPMFTFKGTVPTDWQMLELCPKDALYSESEKGHINSELYLVYVKHLEQFLNRERPVVIFQDNLGSHENVALVEFCMSKDIHLFNFPPKTSHLLQPLDKLFGTFKDKVEDKKHDAVIIQQNPATREKLPILSKFALSSITPHAVREAFIITGIYPLDQSVIPQSSLVGDQQQVAAAVETDVQPSVNSDVTSDANSEDISTHPRAIMTQTGFSSVVSMFILYNREC